MGNPRLYITVASATSWWTTCCCIVLQQLFRYVPWMSQALLNIPFVSLLYIWLPRFKLFLIRPYCYLLPFKVSGNIWTDMVRWVWPYPIQICIGRQLDCQQSLLVAAPMLVDAWGVAGGATWAKHPHGIPSS